MKFKVGDVCVVVPCPCRTGSPSVHVGKECRVLSIDPNDRSGAFYETDIPSTAGHPLYRNCWACDTCLELKKPPPSREQLGDWELCPWRPEPVNVQ